MKKRIIPLLLLSLVTIFLCTAIEQKRLEQQRINLMCGHAHSYLTYALHDYTYAIIDHENKESFDYLYSNMVKNCSRLSEELQNVVDNTDLEIKYPLAVTYLFDFCGQTEKVDITTVYASLDFFAFMTKYILLRQANGPIEITIPFGDLKRINYSFEKVLQNLEELLESPSKIRGFYPVLPYKFVLKEDIENEKYQYPNFKRSIRGFIYEHVPLDYAAVSSLRNPLYRFEYAWGRAE